MDTLVEAMLMVDFRVLIAESGQQALQVLHHAVENQALPDIIILDVSMPGIDGFETCRQIKARPELADIPVIFVTSYNESVQKVRGFDVGGVDYITKPIDLAEVQARLNTHLTIRRLQEQLQAENNDLMQQLQEHIIQLGVAIEARNLLDQEVIYLREERDKLLNLVQNYKNETAKSGQRLHTLSDREGEVLQLIAKSKGDDEIAATLHVTESTVRTHRARIMNKVGAKNAYELMKVAIQYTEERL